MCIRDRVQTGAALAARLVAALVAAPCELIGNAQPQTFGNDLRLVPTHEPVSYTHLNCSRAITFATGKEPEGKES